MIVTPKLGKLLFVVWKCSFCAACEIACCTILKCSLPGRLDMLQTVESSRDCAMLSQIGINSW